MSLSAGKKSTEQKGILMAVIAFMLWGGLPVYWKALHGISAIEIFCHRVVWSFLFIFFYLFITNQLGKVIEICCHKKTLMMLVLSGVALSSNWLIYIWAIVTDRVVESSLGYFINPLLNMFVGICFFHERASKLLWLSIGVAFACVVYQAIIIGYFPWIAILLGATFCLYSVLRKIAVVESMPGLFIETACIAPFTLAYLFLIWRQGLSSFGDTTLVNLLFIGSGIATTLPLFSFTYAARCISLTTLGALQYIAPTLMFILGVFVYHEPMSKDQLITFSCIWFSLTLYSYDKYQYYRYSKATINNKFV